METVTRSPRTLDAIAATALTELALVPLEFAMLVANPVFWGRNVAPGDGHSVIVLPGLGGGDAYLEPMRGWLRRIGYHAVRSGLRFNPGWSERLVDTLGEPAN